MLIALLSDIHANREALSACLAHARQSGAERFIFLGDYVGYGADPEWVVDRVIEHVGRGAIALQGNHDAAIDAPSVRMNPVAAASIDWTRPRLDRARRDFLAALALQREESGRLFVHANAWAPANWGYVLGAEDARRSLAATPCQQTFCGHVHVPCLYHTGVLDKIGTLTPTAGVEIPLLPRRQWLSVLGAVGQPRDGNPAAAYALLDDLRNTLIHVRVAYDVDSAARKIVSAGLPGVLAERLYRGQ